MIKKFNELNENQNGDNSPMIQTSVVPWGKRKRMMVNATITIPISGFLDDDDDRTEIPYAEAIELIRQSLESFAGSNDGSELFLNVNDDEITFKLPK